MELARLFGQMTGLNARIACAIMFTVKPNETRYEILKNVAIVRPYTEWHIIQLGRALAEVRSLEGRLNRQLGNEWTIPFSLAPPTSPNGSTERHEAYAVSDRDLTILAGDLSAARSRIADLLRLLATLKQSESDIIDL
jgi:hypothetical protein